jgi:hypothetical protein
MDVLRLHYREWFNSIFTAVMGLDMFFLPVHFKEMKKSMAPNDSTGTASSTEFQGVNADGHSSSISAYVQIENRVITYIDCTSEFTLAFF